MDYGFQPDTLKRGGMQKISVRGKIHTIQKSKLTGEVKFRGKGCLGKSDVTQKKYNDWRLVHEKHSSAVHRKWGTSNMNNSITK
jgi:hypothetical protein